MLMKHGISAELDPEETEIADLAENSHAATPVNLS